MSMSRRAFVGFAGALLASTALTGPAVAETFAVRFVGQHASFMKDNPKVVLPTYHLNFITSQQATAVASISARSRLAMVLVGPTEAVMRKLANEAHADLRAQFEAAGIPVVSDEEARTLVANAGLKVIPGNIERAGIGPGITIGKSVRRGWVVVGPDAAPALQDYNSMRASPMTMMTTLNAAKPMVKPAFDLGATIIAPALTLDFVNMEASNGSLLGGVASASGEVQFSILLESSVIFMNPTRDGAVGNPGGLRPRATVGSKVPFARVEKGGAAVRVGTMTDVVDENYQSVQRARGDAVVADMVVWEGLVRDAYRSYNAAIVAEVAKAKKPK